MTKIKIVGIGSISGPGDMLVSKPRATLSVGKDSGTRGAGPRSLFLPFMLSRDYYRTKCGFSKKCHKVTRNFNRQGKKGPFPIASSNVMIKIFWAGVFAQSFSFTLTIWPPGLHGRARSTKLETRRLGSSLLKVFYWL